MGIKDEAKTLIAEGALDAAGKLLGVARALVSDGHGLDENDESYGRRLNAEVHGAEAADAVRPRASQEEPTRELEEVEEVETGPRPYEHAPQHETPPTSLQAAQEPGMEAQREGLGVMSEGEGDAGAGEGSSLP